MIMIIQLLRKLYAQKAAIPKKKTNDSSVTSNTTTTTTSTSSSPHPPRRERINDVLDKISKVQAAVESVASTDIKINDNVIIGKNKNKSDSKETAPKSDSEDFILSESDSDLEQTLDGWIQQNDIMNEIRSSNVTTRQKSKLKEDADDYLYLSTATHSESNHHVFSSSSSSIDEQVTDMMNDDPDVADLQCVLAEALIE